jgi:hypothetical protein
MWKTFQPESWVDNAAQQLLLLLGLYSETVDELFDMPLFRSRESIPDKLLQVDPDLCFRYYAAGLVPEKRLE